MSNQYFFIGQFNLIRLCINPEIGDLAAEVCRGVGVEGNPPLLMRIASVGIFAAVTQRYQPCLKYTSTAHWIKNPFRRTSEHNHRNIITGISNFFIRYNPIFYEIQIFF